MNTISATGIGWYNREDYPRILEIMEDADVLPTTYDTWRQKAEGLERQIKASGAIVVRAVIEPKEFVAWCAARGLKVNAKARTAFGSECAYRKINP
jgi:hypothetical protein